MPTFLDRYIAELGSSLDEKAVQSLMEIETVTALSILHRLSTSTQEVRNASAFVEKSVRTAVRDASQRPRELDAAVQRLQQDSVVDDNAVTVLRKAAAPVAFDAVSALLAQEDSTVRNASAYVTRNAINGMQAPPAFVAAQGAPSPAVTASAHRGAAFPGTLMYNPLWKKWSLSLDEKAIAALRGLGRAIAAELLQEMDKSSSEVRNPSAYVSRACENRMKQSGGMALSTQQNGRGAPLSSASIIDRYMAELDPNAIDALRKVGEAQAAIILGSLESSRSEVRNASAWVVRSMKNYKDNGGRIQATAPAPVPPPAAPARRGGIGGLMATLDAEAQANLRSLPSNVARDILSELEAKAGSVKNPSAYVQKSVANAKKAAEDSGVSGTGGFTGAGHDVEGDLYSLLDDGAKEALEEVGAEAAAAILAVLETQKDKVLNPSAYVLKAVGNAKKGKGAGGMAAGGAPVTAKDEVENGGDDPLAHWRHVLDSSAVNALDELPAEETRRIIAELDEKHATVRNPSAYAVRAAVNARNGGSNGANSRAADEVNSLLEQLPAPLDEKATAAIHEVSSLVALKVLQAMSRQEVANPSAYIMKAVANERRLGHNAMQPPMKRARHI